MTQTETVSRSVFFGWRVVAVAFVFAVFAWGVAFYGPSVFLHALHQEKGWPVSLISAAITAHFLLGAALVVYLDDAHRRFGIVATTRAGVVALAFGAASWSLAEAPWQLFAAAVLTAAGWAATSGAAINAMVAPWFSRRRGFALSLAYNGASIGGVLFIPLWVALIQKWGFPSAAAMVAAAALVVLWPLAGIYLRPTPATLGLAPDGDAIAANGVKPMAAREPASRRALLRDRRFVTLASAFAIGLFSQVGLIAHLLTLLVPTLGEQGAAGAVSLTTICAVVGRLLLGGDHRQARPAHCRGGEFRRPGLRLFSAAERQRCGGARRLRVVRPGSRQPCVAAALDRRERVRGGGCRASRGAFDRRQPGELQLCAGHLRRAL